MSDLLSSIETNNLIRKYEAHNNIRGLYEVFITFTIFFATLIGAHWAYQQHNIIFLLPLIFFNSLSIMRLYVLEHDCSHGSLFYFKALNVWVGRLISPIAMTPFYPWRWRHLYHHKTINNIEHHMVSRSDRRDIGYVYFDTVSEYQKKTKINKLLYKLMGNPFLYYMILAPLYIIIVSRFPEDMEDQPVECQKKLRHSILLTNIFILIYYALFVYFFGIKFFLTVYLISSILAIAYGTWLFQIQHIFPGTKFFSYEDENFVDFTFQSTSFYKLPKLLNWFSFSIGYHHIHHLFPTIPGYNLKQCYDENPMFQDVSTVTLWDTPDIMKFRLYDDVKLHRLIAWKEYHRHYPE